MCEKELKEFIEKRKYFFWWVKDPQNLGKESVVEATLNYGNWDDVQELIYIMGIEKVARIFRERSKESSVGRQNYDKKTKNYFNLYFNEHLSTKRNSH